MLGSTLFALPTNYIWLTKALASLDITVLVDRAFRVTVAGLKLLPLQFQSFRGLVGKPFKADIWFLDRYIFLLITCLTSLSRESIVLGSTLVAFQASDIRLTRALASLDIAVLVVRAFRVTVAGLKLKHPQFQDFKGTVGKTV